MTIPAKLKPPSPTRALASLSLEDRPEAPARKSAEAVRDDELEAFRRAWRAEVQAKKEVEVDAGGVLWKSKGDDEKPKEEAETKAEAKGKGKGKGEEAESWPEPLSPRSARAAVPTSPIKALRSRSPVKPAPSAAHVPHRPRSPVKQPQPSARSPTKATFKPVKPAPSARPFPSTAAHPPPVPDASEPASEPTSDSDDTMPFPQRKRGGDAIALYTRAVEAEQGGRLSDALHLYRRAFRADDNVDRLYALTLRKAEAERERIAATAAKAEEVGEVAATLTTADIVDPSAPELPEYTFTREVQVHPDYEKGAVGRVGASRLTGLLERRVGVPPEDTDTANGDTKAQDAHFDPAASFRAADPAQPTPIASLPAELLDRVLSFLDVIGVERFALTCWRARLLTADCGVWRRLAERIYSPPMVPEIGAGRVLARKHRDEWRTTLVEEERLRMDGCYISVCHYIRPGAGEQWVTITHMITYHRFLRFYPDGHVISFLTTDHPSDVVPLLKPTLRAKGLHFGRWRLIRAEDDKGRKRPRVLVTDLVEPGSDAKYEFEMELGLRETGRGRWNKLDLHSYSSINLATGESLGLSLKHQKPFYFSKVRSYNPPF